MKKFLLVLTLFALTACILDKKVDASDEAALQKSIKLMMQDMSPERQKEFQDSMQLIMFEDVNSFADLMAMSKNEQLTKGSFLAKVDGKTEAEIIAMGKEIKRKKSGAPDNNESSDPLSEIKNKAQAQTTKDLMSKTITVTLKSKKYQKIDYDDQIAMVLNIKNNGEKNIKGIKGTAVFKDMFDDTIQSISLSYDQGVKAGQTSEYQGFIDINQFDDQDQRLASIETSNMKFSFIPEVIIFEDGSRIEAE